MAEVAVSQPMQYLDKALSTLRDLGLMPEKRGEAAPITALLNQISDLDDQRVTLIARTLDQMSLFNEVVREQITAMDVGERYNKIAEAFNSIRDDAKQMVDQIEDGRIDTFERLANIWQKVTRGDIASRFDKIKDTYLDVAKATKDQFEREHLILEAYRDFRGALKQSEVMALEVLKKAEAKLERGARPHGRGLEGGRGGDAGRAGRARQARTRPRREAARRCRTRRSATRSPRTSATT